MVRVKKRYIVVEFQNSHKSGSYVELKGKDPLVTVLKAVETMHGEYGAAIIQPISAIFLSAANGLLLLKVPFSTHKLVLSSLPVISNIGGIPASARVLRVAATPVVAYKFLKKYNEKILETFLADQKEYKKKMESIGDSDSD